MQIFYDAQGKLTLQSEVGSTLNSNSSKLLWLSLLPARIKKIQSKLKALEWSQQCYIIHQFLRCSRAANSLIGDGTLTKFKLIPAFIVVLLICKIPGRVAQSVTCLATDASLTADPGVASSIPAWSHTFVEIDHEKISTVILLPSAESFKRGCCQLQAKVCARSTG